MKLTKEYKILIDSLSYFGLLDHWRFAPAGDPWLQGETGEYWEKVMYEKKQEIGPEKSAQISKDIGWNGQEGRKRNEDKVEHQ